MWLITYILVLSAVSIELLGITNAGDRTAAHIYFVIALMTAMVLQVLPIRLELIGEVRDLFQPAILSPPATMWWF